MAFKDIIGHAQPIQRLTQYLRAGKVQGAYLFAGPQGIGKSLVAGTLAKALNCLEGSLDSCDHCASCKKIEKNQHPDVHTIDLAQGLLPVNEGAKQRKTEHVSEEIKIEEIRRLQETINFRPYEGKKKVFIIHDAHAMNQEASHAFLKTLEEPPGDSVIILLSAKPVLLLRTIVSRCQTVKFSALPRASLEDILRRTYHLESSQVHFLSYFCEGRIGSALRLKDTDIVAQKNRIIDQYIVSPHGAAGRYPGTINRQAMREILTVLATWCRDAYFLKAGLPAQDIINLDRKDQLYQFAQRCSCADLDELVQLVSSSLLYIEQNINVKLLLSTLRATLEPLRRG